MGVKTSRIGFVSTRLAGTDGVSLETQKWADVLAGLGHECFYFAGESDRLEECTYLVPEAHFNHPAIETLTNDLFDDYVRSSRTTGLIHKLRFYLKDQLYAFTRAFNVDMLIVENALSIPMNVPLGLALTEFIAETNMPTIAHNHDFSWERSRFSIHSAHDYLESAFPPTLSSIHHVVINTFGARQLALRTGASSSLIPNVMDFDNPPRASDEYASEIRSALGIQPGEFFLLQPTEIAPRKRVEQSIEFTRLLGSNSVLIITQKSDDEGSDYERFLRDYAEFLDVRVVFGSDIIKHSRKELAGANKVFSLADAYQQADLIAYPSTIEGFGNVFIETVYYRRPILISNYEVFKTDLQPKGFRVIGFEDFITQDTVRQAIRVLKEPELAAQMVEHNYEIGRRFYSYGALENSLVKLLDRCLGA